MENQIKWSIDQAHSEIAFKVRHLMIAHIKGSFKIFDANIYTTGKDFTTAEIDVWINASSISTDDEQRDDHLKSMDFLDVLNHKQITFTSRSIGKPDANGNYIIWGELTMIGVTKKMQLEAQFGGIVKDPWGNERAGFTISGKINRRDWGLIWNTTLETGGLMISEEVNISCEVELTNVGYKNLTMELETSANEKTFL